MFRINNQNIEMIQGDSCEFDVSVSDYPIEEGDKIVFSVGDLIKKEINASDKSVVLNPSDTRDLTPGVYRYDVEFRRHDGEIYTIIDPHLFVILADITLPEEVA